MRRIFCILIPILLFISYIEAKNIKLNFMVSGIGGRNYYVEHIWFGGYKLSGWGYSYGIDGSVNVIYKPYRVGLGIVYGVLYEEIVLKAPWYEYDVWLYQGYSRQMFFRALLYTTESFNFWIGFGINSFKVKHAENKWLDRGVWHKVEFDELKDKEEMLQTVCLGTEVKILWDIIFSLKFIFGKNETSIIAEKGAFENLQILLGIGKRFL